MAKQESLFPDQPHKKNTIIEDRLLEGAIELVRQPGTPEDAFYYHSVLCNAFLPLRNPGDDIKIWERHQGNFHLAVQNLAVENPRSGQFEYLGLPYGPKARLLLGHLFTKAILAQSPAIDLGESMTQFVIKELELPHNGRTMRDIKDQLGRIVSSIISLAYSDGEHARQVNMQIIKNFDLWFPKDEKQRVMWPTYIRLTDDMFESLARHAVPVNIRALSRLSHNARAIDLYLWMAYRLHRIDRNKPRFITWKALVDQFMPTYEVKDGKKRLKGTLKEVKTVYPDAKFEENPGGLTFFNSPPPIPPKTSIIVPKQLPKDVRDGRDSFSDFM